MRGAAHIVEDLCFEVDFSSEDEAFEAQERVVRFAQGRAQEVIAEVFDEVMGGDEVLRLGKLEVDVGTVGMEEFEERFAQRLREELMRLLAERCGELDSCAGSDLSTRSRWDAGRDSAAAGRCAVEDRSGVGGLRELFESGPRAVDSLTTGARAELGWLLHFIEYGFLPWHAPGHLGGEVQALGARVLEGNGVQLARALRGVSGARWRVMFRRLVAQFSGEWLARVGREIGVARRHALGAMAEVAGAAEVGISGETGSGMSAVTRIVGADDLKEDSARSRARAQIEAVLGEPAPESGVGLAALAPVVLDTWRGVLRDDAGWLKATLERVGRGIRVRRRLVAVLPEDVVRDVLGLWLSAAQVDVVLATGAGASFAGAMGRPNAPRGALGTGRLFAALSYILVGGGAGGFSEEGYRLSLARLDGEGVGAAASVMAQADEVVLREGLIARPIPRWWLSADFGRKLGTLTELGGTDASGATVTVDAGAVVTVADPGRPLCDVATEANALSRKSMVVADHGAFPVVCQPAGSGVTLDVCSERSGAAGVDWELKADGARPSGALTGGVHDGLGGIAGVGVGAQHSSGAAEVAGAGIQDGSSPTGGAVVGQQENFGTSAAIRGGLRDNPARTDIVKVGTRAPSRLESVRGTDVVDSDDLDEGFARSRARVWIEAVLGETLQSDFQLVGSATEATDIWRGVLRDDAAWVKATLLRLGRAVRVRRRLAAALPEEVVADFLALWLSRAQMDVVSATVGNDTVVLPGEWENAGATRGAISAGWLLATLTYLLVEGGAWEFSEADYRGSLARGLRDGSGGLRGGPHEVRAADEAGSRRDRTVAALNVPDRAAGDVANCPVQGRDTAEWERDAALLGLTSPLAAQLDLVRADQTGKEHRRPDAALREAALVAPARHVDSAEEETLAASATDVVTSDVELLRHLRGRVSSNSSTHELRRALRAMVDRRSVGARSELLTSLEYPGAGRRLAALLAGGGLLEVLQWLRPTDGAMALAVAARVAHLGKNASDPTGRRQEDFGGLFPTGGDGSGSAADTTTDRDAVTRVVAELVVTELFEEGRTFDAEPFAKRLAAALEAGGPSAAIANVGGRSPVRPVSSVEDADIHQRIYIANAGVALVAAYLPRLFSMLELTNEMAFTSTNHAHRAVHLIQYIVTGATATPEPLLVLNKILCGLPISEPVPLDIDLRAKERAAIEEMLTAIIVHWKAIGRTSIAGLRESFLQREGRLVSGEESWQLRVESKCFDMLLDRLPWGYTTVKFPWMKRVLRVDWR